MSDLEFSETEMYQIRTCPADQCESSLNLNHYLIQNQEATFFLRFNGSSIPEANIYNDDLLLVDRSVPAARGKNVVVVVEEGFKLGRVVSNGIIIDNILYNDTLEVWGVVTHIIRKL